VNKGECKPTAAVNEGLHPPVSGCKKTYEETLMDVYDYSVEVGLPYRISFLSSLASIVFCVVGTLLTPADTCCR
jgi:hypothetical protein